MKIKRKQIYSLNLIAFVLFIIPAFNLDLTTENYSTLSLNTRGYLYLLFLGIMIGLIFYYETYHISNKKYALSILLAMIMGTIIPHHVPYNLQGNLHLLFAYLGFIVMISITIINIYYKNIKLFKYYSLLICMGIITYLIYGMVTTLGEIIVMFATMLINMVLFKGAYYE